MKSIHFIATDDRRGAETFAVDLVGELRRQGNDAGVWALRPTGLAGAHRVPHLAKSRRGTRLWRQLRRVSFQADVVVAHGSATLEAAAIGLLRARVPFVYRVIGDPKYWVRSQTKQLVIGTFLAQSARIVTLWEGAKGTLIDRYGLDETRIDVIPNAVDTSRFSAVTSEQRAASRAKLGLRSDTAVLLYVGALSREKNVPAAVAAVAEINDAILLVVGEGPERSSLEALSQEMAPGRVRFLGQLADPSSAYAVAKLLLLPSLSEGMPAVVIEAGCAGVPVVASSVGAIPEMTRDGVDGILVRSGDKGAFVSAVQAALNDANRLAVGARSRFQYGFGIADVAGRWQETLEAAVDGRKGS